MPDLRDFLPAKFPYLPLPQGLIGLLEIPGFPTIYFKPGDMVYHWKYGRGTILAFREAAGRLWVVDIEFEEPEYGTKTFFSEVPYLSKKDISELTERHR